MNTTQKPEAAITKEDMTAIFAITKRAQRMGISRGSQATQFMDIEAAHRQFNLRLKDWLEADDFNFVHDFIGIQSHMNRETGKVENHFLPRFVCRKSDYITIPVYSEEADKDGTYPVIGHRKEYI